MEPTKAVVKSCNTCAHHKQGTTLNDAPAHCWDCVNTTSLVYWEPLEVPVLSVASYCAKLTDDSPLTKQVSGDHYKSLKIQPIEFIHANDIPYMEGNVIKYVTRWRSKNGTKDLEKAKHYIELLIELEGKADV